MSGWGKFDEKKIIITKKRYVDHLMDGKGWVELRRAKGRGEGRLVIEKSCMNL